MARKRTIAVGFATAAAALACSTTAPAAPGLGFSAIPAPTSHANRAYFTLDMNAGQTKSDTLIVINSSTSTQRLLLSVSRGTTAKNSGAAYVPTARCSKAACWIHGLPQSVMLAPKAQRRLPFSIVAPSSLRPGQYLAGITLRPAGAGTPEIIKPQSGGLGARVAVIREMTIGVAVSIGDPAAFTQRLAVTRVIASPSAARLVIRERNTGQTFVHAKGVAECVGGGARFTYPVTSSTVLPGDFAELQISAPQLHRGTGYRCSVSLDYGGRVASSWHGTVRVPKTSLPKIVQTGPHRFSTLPKAAVPRWAIALIAAGGVIVLALIVVIVLLLRRRPTAAA